MNGIFKVYIRRSLTMQKKKAVKVKNEVVESIKESFLHHRRFSLAKDIYSATDYDNYQSMALTIRDRLIEKWILTQQRYHDENCKRVYYFSLEFLLGRFLENNIQSLGLESETARAMNDLGLDLEDLYTRERDPGLGNGGLGRLAACFMDSMATLGVPATGYGIRYDYGIFTQKIVNGSQIEMPDEWLSLGNPWEFERPEYTLNIKFYGKTVKRTDKNGKLYVDWLDTRNVLALAYDIPVAGYKNDVVNNLRLWSAKSTAEFDFEYFNDGDYIKACENKIVSENISRVLYPSDSISKGQELRLKQEYFFTSASIQDIIRRYKRENEGFTVFPDKVAIQLNDTHPAISIAELMRLLVDEEELEWDQAWDITTRTFSYTNHTIMPEALEKWPVRLFGRLLPRHLEIIYEINMRFLKEVSSHYPHDNEKLARMSIIEEGPEKMVRMSHLSIVGSHKINGVSKLHYELLKTHTFKDFADFWPDRFTYVTNGITQRRWLNKANPGLASFITENIGGEWIKELGSLRAMIPLADDAGFRDKWRAIKKANKETLASLIKKEHGLSIDLDSIFDVQVKRIHEYKRQLMFAFFLIARYLEIKKDPGGEFVSRTAIISGKAAPGYSMAKLIIKFINNIADVINNDPDIKDRLKIVFLENYGVTLAEKIFPASDLSEQISTAGMEASGTGNMKFMLNGAVTIGTWDGANIEIAEEVGRDNIFIFGLRAEEVEEMKRNGYDPRDHIKKGSLLEEIIDLVNTDFFSRFEPGIFSPIVRSLLEADPFMIIPDFSSYLEAQEKVRKVFSDTDSWTRMSVTNAANSGKFSSDRAINNYSRDIWGI
jgi:starch phosphorylase